MYIYTCIHIHIHLLERKEAVFLIYINTYQYTLKYGWSGRYMNAHANTNEHTTRVHMHNPHCNTDMCISFRLLFTRHACGSADFSIFQYCVSILTTTFTAEQPSKDHVPAVLHKHQQVAKSGQRPL